MYSWRNYKHKVSKYFKFSLQEILGMLFTIIVCAFIMSFTKWGTTKFNLGMGLFNFFNTALIVLMILVVQESIHRLVALLAGYQVKYKPWKLGLIIGLVLVFFSNGSLTFIVPGGIVVTHLAVHRIGKFRYGPNYNNIGWIAMTGPIACILMAIIFKLLSYITPNSLLFISAMNIAILFAVIGLLPIPPLNGHQLFFGSRYIYIGVCGLVLAAAGALYFMGVFGTILSALIFGALAMILYFVFVDKQW